VEGPLTGVPRHSIPFRRLSLTDFKIAVPKGARQKTVKAAFTKGDIAKKFAATRTGLKLAQRQKRSAATDFDRHKIMIAQIKVCLFI
jgi:large subunit ribosomal protein L14e